MVTRGQRFARLLGGGADVGAVLGCCFRRCFRVLGVLFQALFEVLERVGCGQFDVAQVVFWDVGVVWCGDGEGAVWAAVRGAGGGAGAQTLAVFRYLGVYARVSFCLSVR